LVWVTGGARKGEKGTSREPPGQARQDGEPARERVAKSPGPSERARSGAKKVAARKVIMEFRFWMLDFRPATSTTFRRLASSPQRSRGGVRSTGRRDVVAPRSFLPPSLALLCPS
jgi:hypothetical protein